MGRLVVVTEDREPEPVLTVNRRNEINLSVGFIQRVGKAYPILGGSQNLDIRRRSWPACGDLSAFPDLWFS
ncbi:MAG TPA: hypothetical protein VE891_12015 [Allosphingosinicella sp.]|nr:hypothetical protein [Allosphingosinicella sp.]